MHVIMASSFWFSVFMGFLSVHTSGSSSLYLFLCLVFAFFLFGFVLFQCVTFSFNILYWLYYYHLEACLFSHEGQKGGGLGRRGGGEELGGLEEGETVIRT